MPLGGAAQDDAVQAQELGLVRIVEDAEDVCVILVDCCLEPTGDPALVVGVEYGEDLVHLGEVRQEPGSGLAQGHGVLKVSPDPLLADSYLV